MGSMATPPPRIPPFLATGHAEVDEQHAGILAQVERLRSAHARVVPVMLSFLDQHTRAHFAYEDLLMSESGYPEAAAHRAEHEDLLAALAAWRAVLDSRGPDAVHRAGLLSTMERWIDEHVLQADRRLARYMRGRSAAARAGDGGLLSPSSRLR